MKKIITSFLLLLFFILPAEAKRDYSVTQLQLRELQTHVFETKNTDLVYQAAINTLQDNGFIIENAEEEVGYIRAKKEFKARDIDKKRVSLYSSLLALQITCAVFTYGAILYNTTDPAMRLSNELSDKTIVVDSNVNVEPFGNGTRVRFTLVRKTLETADGYSYIKSAPRKVKRIIETALYQEFFNQLDKNIFYESI